MKKKEQLVAAFVMLFGLVLSPLAVEYYQSIDGNNVVIAQAPDPALPNISIPKELTGDVGQFIEVKSTTNGKQVNWAVLNQQGLNLFPMDLLKDSKTAVAVAQKEGIYYLHAWTALGDIPSELQTCKITIGKPIPPVPPTPIPVPPGPIPPVPPQPIPPTPTPTKLSVLFVDEANDYGTAAYKPYLSVLNSTDVRAYLNAHTAQEDIPNAGQLPSWRRWDQNEDVSHESAKWQKLMQVKRDSLPWLIIADANGNVLSSSAVPNSISATLDLLKKYGG